MSKVFYRRRQRRKPPTPVAPKDDRGTTPPPQRRSSRPFRWCDKVEAWVREFLSNIRSMDENPRTIDPSTEDAGLLNKDSMGDEEVSYKHGDDLLNKRSMGDEEPRPKKADEHPDINSIGSFFTEEHAEAPSPGSRSVSFDLLHNHEPALKSNGYHPTLSSTDSASSRASRALPTIHDFAHHSTDLVSLQSHASEDGDGVPTATGSNRASVRVSMKTLSAEDQAELRHGAKQQGQELSGQSPVEYLENDEERSEGSLSRLCSRTPPSSLAIERMGAVSHFRHGTWPGDLKRPDKRSEIVHSPTGASQAGPSMSRSSHEHPSRKSSIATSAQSDEELNNVLNIGINDTNGKKHFRLLTLDTYSAVNLVAESTAKELRLPTEKYEGGEIKGLGGGVRPVGQVELSFSIVPDGQKTITAIFLVLRDEDAEWFDAVASFSLVKKYKLLRSAKKGTFMARL